MSRFILVLAMVVTICGCPFSNSEVSTDDKSTLDAKIDKSDDKEKDVDLSVTVTEDKVEVKLKAKLKFSVSL